MSSNGLINRTFSFESTEAYLLDSYQRFKTGYFQPTELLKFIVDQHNKDVSKDKQVSIRKNDFAKSKKSAYIKVEYQSTKDALKSLLCKNFGGLVTFSYEKGMNYLDYIDISTKDYQEKHTHKDVPIEIGINLKEIKQEIDPSNIVTRLIPVGAEKEGKKIKMGDDDSVDESGSLTGATGKVHGSWRDAIKHAARLMNESPSEADINKILAVIQAESRGIETIVQGGYSNDPDGDGSGRAIGLLQFKKITFNQYKMNGFGNIRKGFHQLVALFNIKDWRGALTVGGWNPTGHGCKYENRKMPHKYVSSKKTTSLNKWGWPFPSIGKGSFMSVQQFGVHPGNGRTNNFHDGLDFGSVDHPGSQIHAIHGGTVIHAGYKDSSIGYYIVTRSNDGYYIVYQEFGSSMSNVLVKVGQTVKTGQVIATRNTDHVHIGVCKKPHTWDEGYSHSFDPHWYWLDPAKLIEHNGQKGDKASSSKYYTEKKTGERITISSVNNGKDYILADKDVIKQFGYIAKIVQFDDAKDADTLLKKAKAYLKKQNTIKTSYSLSALEVGENEFKRYVVGDFYPTNTKQLVIAQDQILQITQKEIDIVNSPNSSSIECGDKVIGLSEYQIDINKSFKKSISKLQSSLLSVDSTISNVQSASEGIEEEAQATSSKNRKSSDQTKFNLSLLKKDFKKYKKDTNKHLKKNDKAIKEIQDSVKKISDSITVLGDKIEEILSKLK